MRSSACCEARCRSVPIALTCLAMARRFVGYGVTHRQTPSFASTEELRRLAGQHAIDRLGHMLETTLMLAMTRHFPALRASPPLPVSHRGAVVQDRTADRPDTQAAHILPCQILFGGREPKDLDLPEEVRVALQTRFAVTAALPTPFNRADSESEKQGLSDLFADMVRSVWHRPPFANPIQQVAHCAPGLAARACEGGHKAFRAAAKAKRERETPAERRADERRVEVDFHRAKAAAGSFPFERLTEALILEAYDAAVPTPSELVNKVGWGAFGATAYEWREWLGESVGGAAMR